MTRWTPFLRDLWDGLRTRPGRTALSLFAIGVGMTALTLLIAVLGGLQQRSEHIVRELGANVVAVFQTGTPGTSQAPLQTSDLETLRANLPGSTLSAARSHRTPAWGVDHDLPVLATDQHLASIRQWTITSGRWLDQVDLEQAQRHAVISAPLARKNGWHCGDLLLLRDTPFVIVGIVEAEGNGTSRLQSASAVNPGDEVVYVPITVPPYWERTGTAPHRRLDAIFVRVPDATDLYRVRDTAQNLLRGTAPPAGPLALITPDVLLQGIRRLQRTVQLTAGSIAVLCLILGGTTLMSLMVATVQERIHEIGLRQSLGATPMDIAWLFAGEACLVTFVASVAGTAAGHLLLLAGSPWLPTPVQVGPASLLIPIAASLVLGVLFATGPARKASRIPPADALRAP